MKASLLMISILGLASLAGGAEAAEIRTSDHVAKTMVDWGRSSIILFEGSEAVASFDGCSTGRSNWRGPVSRLYFSFDKKLGLTNQTYYKQFASEEECSSAVTAMIAKIKRGEALSFHLETDLEGSQGKYDVK